MSDLKDILMIFYIYLLVNKSHEKTKTSNELILRTSIAGVDDINHNVALGDVFLRYHDRCRSFWVDPRPAAHQSTRCVLIRIYSCLSNFKLQRTAL